MNYLADCECGRVLTVTAADAGGKVRCECGEELGIPSLGQLRRLGPPPPRPPRPPVDYAFLRRPGVITAVAGILSWCVSGWGYLPAMPTNFNNLWVSVVPGVAGAVAVVVGLVLVYVSKRFPVLVTIVFAVLGLVPLLNVGCVVAALLLPERLPPVPPPPR